MSVFIWNISFIGPVLNPDIFVYFSNQFHCALSSVVDVCRIQPLENISKFCLVEEKLLFSDCISFDSSGLKSLSFRLPPKDTV